MKIPLEQVTKRVYDHLILPEVASTNGLNVSALNRIAPKQVMTASNYNREYQTYYRKYRSANFSSNKEDIYRRYGWILTKLLMFPSVLTQNPKGIDAASVVE